MRLLSFDHRRPIRNLQDAGFDEGQATALINVMIQYIAHPEASDRNLSVATLRRGGFNDEQASALIEAFDAFVAA